MKHLLICVSAALAMCAPSFAHAQTDEQAKHSEEVMKKIRQIDLLNQMLPLALTKDQINQLLPPIEKARQAVKDQQKEEAKLLQQYEGKVDSAIAAGIDKGDVPNVELLRELSSVIGAMYLKRDAVATDNMEKVYAVMKKVLNAGQMKVAANSLNPKFFNPGVKIEEMTDEQKTMLFVREILLDPQSYDMLRRLLKRAS